MNYRFNWKLRFIKLPFFLGLFFLILRNPIQAQIIYQTNVDLTVTITGYNGTLNGALIIPDNLNGLPVTTIATNAFKGKLGLTSVNLGTNLLNIQQTAFSSCSNLTQITFGGTVTNIGIAAFRNCTSLKGLTIPDSIVSVGALAFLNCIHLTKLNTGDGLLSIDSSVFAGCRSLTNVVFGTNISNIDFEAFYSCSNLTEIDIPNSVTNVGEAAFNICDKLGKVTIGSGVQSFGIDAFSLCPNLYDVTIKNGVTTLGQNMFYGCTGLTSIIIPDSVTNIGSGAFIFCYNLTNVTLGSGVVSIGGDAFESCAFSSIIFSKNLMNIADAAFWNTASLKDVYFNGNAPTLGGTKIFRYDNPTIHYLPGTLGWDQFLSALGLSGSFWTLPWPMILNGNPDFGIQNNIFGFTVSWATNIPVVIEVCADLANPIWTPVTTNSLVNGTTQFSDPNWTNYPSRFYRVNSP
jgi:hypothetical protein